ncbi:hypothetical protein [Amycolatopsis sp. NPDC051128]|uniref:hypothetical protein n=1 Tax=Amycolatopsis sp. NPDC051128 TaxID=3155412 RepID=UPI0034351C2E
MSKRRLYAPARGARVTSAAAPSDSSAKALRLISSVLAPTTVLTALLFFFGRQHATWLFDYFGVPLSEMGLTAQDYLVRSADGLFTPMAVVMAAALTTLWGHRVLRARLSETAWERLLRVLTPMTVLFGLAGVTVATVGVLAPETFESSYAVPGAGLALGVTALLSASRLNRRTARPLPGALAVTEWAVSFVLVSVGLFWAVADYSASVGIGRAMEIEAALAVPPETVLYSAKNLSLHAPGVRETVCGTPDAAYRYRYTGLKFVLQSGGRYLLLPRLWTKGTGTAIVLPRTDALRLEFTSVADPGAPC